MMLRKLILIVTMSFPQAVFADGKKDMEHLVSVALKSCNDDAQCLGRFVTKLTGASGYPGHIQRDIRVLAESCGTSDLVQEQDPKYASCLKEALSGYFKK